MHKYAVHAMITVLLAGFSAKEGKAANACNPSTLTDDEAQILLYVSPPAVLARESGTDVVFERSEPDEQFPAGRFFVAAITSLRPTRLSSLGNGDLGYFIVDKQTAEVQSLGDLSTVKGKELGRVQALLRHSHCISEGH
jgi:hypothetical protein